jgi:hypothetical protein
LEEREFQEQTSGDARHRGLTRGYSDRRKELSRSGLELMLVFSDKGQAVQFSRQRPEPVLENGPAKWVDVPQLCGVHQNFGCPGNILLNFPNQLAGGAAVKLPQQFQVQCILGTAA